MPGCVQITLQMMFPTPQTLQLGYPSCNFLLLYCLVMGQNSPVCQTQIQGVLTLMSLLRTRYQQTGQQHDAALGRPDVAAGYCQASHTVMVTKMKGCARLP